MDFESVKQLADLMDERGLTKVEVQEGEHRISLSKEQAVTVTAAPAAASTAPGVDVPEPPAEPSEAEAQEGEALTSPLVGVVYLAPEPGAKPFTGVGAKVKKGQTLCIVEAMKVMNEFTAPRDGVIAEVCVKNEELVEYGQALFRLA